MTKTLTLNGNNVHDITSFYEEVNRTFMEKENWQLGESLDAFNDLLHGGFGAIEGDEPVRLVWTAFEQSRQVLGLGLTREYYRKKLEFPSTFNVDFVNKQIEALEQGKGPTYFEIILEIIADHPNIELIPQ